MDFSDSDRELESFPGFLKQKLRSVVFAEVHSNGFDICIAVNMITALAFLWVFVDIFIQKAL